MSTLFLQPLPHHAPRIAVFVSAVCASLLAAALALCASLLLIAQASTGMFAVESDSMAPAFSRGDMVVLAAITQPHTSDVVTFRKYGKLVTHRLVEEGRAPGSFETRGDANMANDPWTITQRDMVGRVHAVIPHVGWLLLLLNLPAGRVAMALAVMLLVSGFAWAWPRATRVPGILLHPSNGFAVA